MATVLKSPRHGTQERVDLENRRACLAFLGPNGAPGGHPPDFDEPPDPTEAISAKTLAEWKESQLGEFVDGLEDILLVDDHVEPRYPAQWYGFVLRDLGPEHVPDN